MFAALATILLSLSAFAAVAADSITRQDQGNCPDGYHLDGFGGCVKNGIEDGPDPVGGKQATEPRTPTTVTDDPDPWLANVITATQIEQARLIIVPAQIEEETFTEPALPDEIVEGTITNGTCSPGAVVTSIHVDGNPADVPEVLRQLARCDVSEVTFEDRSGRFDLTAFSDQLSVYFDMRTMHACSSLSECGIRIDVVCGREGSTGKTSALELDARSTATGEACTGTCANGKKVRVICIKADPRLQV